MKLSELAGQLDARLEGDGAVEIRGVSPVSQAEAGDVTFLTDLRYAGALAVSSASAVLVGEDFEGECSASRLYVKDVSASLESVLDLFRPESDRPVAGVHPSAVIDESAQLEDGVCVGACAVVGAGAVVGKGSVIGSGCHVGGDVRIGEHCELGPNVVIRQGCVLGDRVVINSNSTIGTDGFGYRMVGGRYQKVPHIGIVEIEDDVEVGANVCIDRAKCGRTLIGAGTKIDNLVQIAHNVQIGKHCIVVSETGIAGSSELGDYVVLAGQCGVSDHVRIGARTQVGPGTGIGSRSEVPSDDKIMGAPHQSFVSYYREVSLLRKLPELFKTVKKLEKKS